MLDFSQNPEVETSERFNEGESVHFFQRGPKFGTLDQAYVKSVDSHFLGNFKKETDAKNLSVLRTKIYEKFSLFPCYKNSINASLSYQGLTPLFPGYSRQRLR